MNDTVYVTELLRRLNATDDPTLFDALFTLYIHRYRQVLSNSIRFTVVEKVPLSLCTTENDN
ncbi:hypothetical protein [Larkinella humicola]|uniref:Uncharacterized protein n=1 Tax=Larkinella humicola TaxID=2607654 RepID=A0A5N1JIR4_9BACT|nr:hypothetical protein [Larkinella humicola]KAA9356340.1 hypothetical protein F0P93_00875 [Larkinella humicola]